MDEDDLREQLFQEILDRTEEADMDAPFRKGPWLYYRRTAPGSQYPVMARVPVGAEPHGPAETVLLDCGEAASGHDYFALGAFELSPGGMLLAYSVDTDGNERFELRIRDLTTGRDLDDRIAGVGYGCAWIAGASAVYYVTADESWRPFRVHRHVLGTPAEEDETVFEEPDERFFVEVRTMRSEGFVEIRSTSRAASESWLLDAGKPDAQPTLVAARRDGVRYSLDHLRGDDGGSFLVLHNPGGGPVFELAVAPAVDPGRWEPWFPLRSDVHLTGIHAFATHVVLEYRRDGRTAMSVHPVRDGRPEPCGREIRFAEPAHTVTAGLNPDYETGAFRFCHTSLTTPAAFYDHVLATGENRLLRSFPVRGGHRPEDYVQHRLWAVAADGVRIPVSVVARAGVPLDGSAPAVLEGYGAYGEASDPFFSVERLPLLDRGFVYAIAHVRGGGEYGPRWHDAGRLRRKMTSFTDFIACARRLCAQDDAGRRWTSPDRLAARGTSAGGLLVAAAANLAPDAFGAVVAEMPFVGVLDALLDPEAALTVTEWEEWGNPIESAGDYAYISAYSPCENVRPMHYPDVLAVTAPHDVRVAPEQAARWIARLRATAVGGEFRLETLAGGGHGGASGRYDAWRDQAGVLAWIVRTVGSRTVGFTR